MIPPRGGAVRRCRIPSLFPASLLAVLAGLVVLPATAVAEPVDARVAALAEIADGGLYVQERAHLLAMGDTALVDLERIAADPDIGWRARAAAAACRGWIAEPARYEAFFAAEPAMTRAGLPQYRKGEPEVDRDLLPLLVEMLVWTEQDPMKKLAVVDLLKRMKDPATVDALGWALGHDGSLAVRRAAVEGLERATDPRATGLLLDTLQGDGISEIRAAAAAALGWRKDPAALPALLRTLARDEDVNCRARSAQSIGWIGDPAADLSLVLALQSDPSPRVRVQAALALGRLGGDRAREALYQAAQADPDPEVVRHAKGAIEGL